MAAIRHAWLVKFDFLSGPYYVWQGFRSLSAGGIIWQPVGPSATVGDVQDTVSDSVASVTLKVSGVSSALLAIALGESDEIQGRLASIFELYFDDRWQPIGTPSAYSIVRMDTIKITKQRNSDGSYDQVIGLACENYLTNGPNPPFGRYSTMDQQARLADLSPVPTDLYFEYMGANQNRRQRWPTF